MNKEIIKAMNKRKKNQKFKKWYGKHYKTIWRTILFPLYFLGLAIEKYNKYRNDKTKWSEERAKEILNYYIPKRADWIEEDKTFYFFDNGCGWGSLSKKYIKRKDRRFWKLYSGYYGHTIREYLIEKFELEGFEKAVQDICWHTEITFKLIEK